MATTTTSASTANVASGAGRRQARPRPEVSIASPMEMSRQTAIRPMRMRTVSAVDGASMLTANSAMPPTSCATTTMATTITGRAKMTALRLNPAYHWPRPGQRKERRVASVGDRRRPPRVSALKSAEV